MRFLNFASLFSGTWKWQGDQTQRFITLSSPQVLRYWFLSFIGGVIRIIVFDLHPIIYIFDKIKHLWTLLLTENIVNIHLIGYKIVLDVAYVWIHLVPGLLEINKPKVQLFQPWPIVCMPCHPPLILVLNSLMVHPGIGLEFIM